MRKSSSFVTLWTLFFTLVFVGSALAQTWKFGVMSDTQWIGTDDGKNPNSVSVDIIKAVNQEFINKGVKFVVQVGDLCDNGSVPAGEDTRAAFAQDLYNAGIGFFPFRGNHDSSVAAAAEFLRIYPQT
ncbi:MAG TPA: metallophosphoesterase, partial [Geobacteraceae bacterium]|nr:metallophosphoesterase [Geobacteraceae bacterium]